MRRSVFLSLLLLLILLSAACSAPESADESAAAPTGAYRQITQSEAMALMESEPDCVILDVRRQDEYDAGHIIGAICVPNESITDQDVPELPDRDQMILVYCRSGRRSKEAAQKLADIGYTNVLEFGGIIDWQGATATE